MNEAFGDPRWYSGGLRCWRRYRFWSFANRMHMLMRCSSWDVVCSWRWVSCGSAIRSGWWIGSYEQWGFWQFGSCTWLECRLYRWHARSRCCLYFDLCGCVLLEFCWPCEVMWIRQISNRIGIWNDTQTLLKNIFLSCQIRDLKTLVCILFMLVYRVPMQQYLKRQTTCRVYLVTKLLFLFNVAELNKYKCSLILKKICMV